MLQFHQTMKLGEITIFYAVSPQIKQKPTLVTESLSYLFRIYQVSESIEHTTSIGNEPIEVSHYPICNIVVL